MMLEGIRVVDLSQNIAGPQATQVLGDLGAEVVKVEPPGGDPARRWGPPFWGGDAPLFLAFNRNKRSIVADLKTARGQEVVERLLEGADVLVQAFRRGVIERFGFGYEEVRRRHPRLIYASLTGYGSEGPYADSPGYDPLLQAYSGIMSITGEPDGPPARVGGSVVDIGSGNLIALGVLAALRKRDQEGVGTHIECSLLDTALGWIGYHMMAYLASGDVPRRMGTGLAMVAPYEAFPTKDGQIMICGGTDGIFRRLCQALEIPEVAEDPRFRDNPSRVKHCDVLRGLLSERTSRHRTRDLDRLLRAHKVPGSPIQSIDEVVDDPQVRANRIFEPEPHPKVPGYRDMKMSVRFDGERPPLRRVPPAPGEHTREILSELGYSEESIARYAEEVKIREPAVPTDSRPSR